MSRRQVVKWCRSFDAGREKERKTAKWKRVASHITLQIQELLQKFRREVWSHLRLPPWLSLPRAGSMARDLIITKTGETNRSSSLIKD
ncbi:hypothetical protein TNCV_213711 [Trichonephila clavipes]|nr:hypothetical protein TNCV_213711 [Trichonephila clavipes]